MIQKKEFPFEIGKGSALPFGVMKNATGNTVRISVWAKNQSMCRLILYRAGKKINAIPMFSMSEDGLGDIFSLCIKGKGAAEFLSKCEYVFETDEGEFADPYGRWVIGRETFGRSKKVRVRFCFDEFDWSGEDRKRISFDEMIMYQCHVRGFTKHASSGVSSRGTFKGVAEKADYLLDLGVNTLLFLPIYDFNEKMTCKDAAEDMTASVSDKKINYWGYTKDAFYFAPKASYCDKGVSPEIQLKSMVKQLHQKGMNLILDMHFEGKTPDFVLDCLRYYVTEFHIDGFLINQNMIKPELIVNDPILRNVKLLGTGWEELEEKERRLAAFNDGFLVDTRKFLKSDEGMVQIFYDRFRNQGSNVAIINYITQKNGFTLKDLVSYDIKHNEANGERNQDGTEYNYSWNCGAEGTTRRKGVNQIRKQQMKNALAMLLLSMGTPMLLAGDEFGNSQRGNNNAYCQDNTVTWLNWNDLEKNKELFEYTKTLLAFRKRNLYYHRGKLQGFDYKGCGAPDISCHGIEPWVSNFVNYSRELGIMLYGSYFPKDEKTVGHSVYIAFNMHWEPHEFFLPTIDAAENWKVVLDTGKKKKEKERKGNYGYVMDPRSVVIFESAPGPKGKLQVKIDDSLRLDQSSPNRNDDVH